MSKVIKKTKESIRYTLSTNLLRQGITFFSSIILARLLDPTDFGILAIVQMIVFYANNFTNFGLNNALVQKKDLLPIHIDSVFTIDLAISIVLYLILIFLSPMAATFFNHSEIKWVLIFMGLYLIITTFYYIPIAILRRNIQFKFLSLLEVVQTIIGIGLTIFLAFWGFRYWSIAIGEIASTLLIIIPLCVKTKWYPKLAYSHKRMKEIYSFGGWNFMRTQFDLIVNKIDYFVIGHYLGTKDLGFYEKGFEIASKPTRSIAPNINSVYFSTFSRIQKDKAKVKELFLKGANLVTIINYPILFGLVAVAPHFVIV